MIPFHDLLFGCAALLYFLGSVIFLANLFLKNQRLSTSGMALALGGLLCHTVSIILHISIVTLGNSKPGVVPFSTLAEGWSFLAWAIVAVFLSISVRPRLRSLGAFALPTALVSLLAAAGSGNALSASLPGGIPAWELALHVPASILSLGAFTMAFGCAVAYLIQDHLLKEKKLGGLLRVLPPLDVLDTTSYWLVVFGFCLLTVGMISGFILAHDAWKTSWLGHSKVYISVLLWLIYGLYLYVRGIANWRGRQTHTMVVVAVIALAFVYGGTVLLSGPTAPSHASVTSGQQRRTG